MICTLISKLLKAGQKYKVVFLATVSCCKLIVHVPLGSAKLGVFLVIIILSQDQDNNLSISRGVCINDWHGGDKLNHSALSHIRSSDPCHFLWLTILWES